MTDKTRKPFQFSLRTVLVLLLVIGAAMGFWLQEQRLDKARRILASHGLSLELADLKPGQVRATVTNRLNGGSFVWLTMLIETREAGSMVIKSNRNKVLATVLYPATDGNSFVGEVRVLVVRIQGSDGRPVVKRVLWLGARGSGAQIDSTLPPPNDLKLSEFVTGRAPDSGMFELGESIPLIDIGDEQFELEVK
jgi:hypothetical protein